MSETLHPFSAARLPPSADPVAASAAVYATEVAELLFNLLVDVVRERAPDAEALLTGDISGSDLPLERVVRAMQAQGIWYSSPPPRASCRTSSRRCGSASRCWLRW